MKPHGDPFKHFYSVQILEKHLDTFGHVNHATYFQILEEARWDLVTSRGFGVKEIQTSHQGPVILEAHIEFKREILLRQTITVETQLKSLNRKIASIFQEIFCEGRICAEASFKIGLFDTHRRRLISPTPQWLHAIGADEPTSGHLLSCEDPGAG